MPPQSRRRPRKRRNQVKPFRSTTQHLEPRTFRTAPETSSSDPPPAFNTPGFGIVRPATEVAFETLSAPDGYVDSSQCRECHQSQWESFQKSDHSRTLQSPTLASLHGQSGIVIDHKRSGRRYEQNWDGGQLWHQESIAIDEDGDSQTDFWMATGRWPVRYVIGSGAIAEGYLLGDGPYLVQSPITWYSGGEKFDMAPGYQVASQMGMTRTVNRDCLGCHTGWVTSLTGSPFESIVGEESVSCQRCHGPGQLHADHHRQALEGSSSLDQGLTDQTASLAHPRLMDRTESESICAQCHLEGPLMIQPGENAIHDFRPGDDLDAFRAAYYVTRQSADGTAKPHTFVGHFDQMWQSACYLQSETMTCVTCHSPHHNRDPSKLIVARRQQCLECHQEEHAIQVGCGVPMPQRLATHENQCVACHMPRTDSEVPHSPTTNHRIAVYDASDFEPMDHTLEIRSIRSPGSSMPMITSQRLDRLASAAVVVNQLHGLEVTAEEMHQELDKLNAFRNEVVDDAELQTAAASLWMRWLYRRDQNQLLDSPSSSTDAWDQVAELAGRAAAAFRKEREAKAALYPSRVPMVSEAEIESLDVLAGAWFESERYSDSAAAYQRLTRLRRKSTDWYNLGLCLGRIKQFAAVESAMAEAIRIDGTDPLAYRSMSRLLGPVQPEMAARYAAYGEWLQRRKTKILDIAR